MQLNENRSLAIPRQEKQRKLEEMDRVRKEVGEGSGRELGDGGTAGRSRSDLNIGREWDIEEIGM